MWVSRTISAKIRRCDQLADCRRIDVHPAGCPPHRHEARRRRTLADYEELRDIIAMLGIEELSSHDRAVVARARRLERFLTQPFATVTASTGTTGRLVPISETLDGCETILGQDNFERPESDYYMIGALSDLPPLSKEANA